MTYDKLKVVSAEKFLKEKKLPADGFLFDLLDEYAEIKCRELNELLDIQIEAYLSAGTNKEDLLSLMKEHYEGKKQEEDRSILTRWPIDPETFTEKFNRVKNQNNV